MGKELAKREVSDFGSHGFNDWPWPNFYAENQIVRDYSDLSDEAISAKANEYNLYLKADLMPRAKAEVARVLTYLAFEAAWRLGAFTPAPSDTSELIIMESRDGEILPQG